MPMHYDHARAIYLQIMDDIRQRIISGEYQCDEKIAPVRELAVRYEVNPNTMQKALTELDKKDCYTRNARAGVSSPMMPRASRLCEHR